MPIITWRFVKNICKWLVFVNNDKKKRRINIWVQLWKNATCAFFRFGVQIFQGSFLSFSEGYISKSFAYREKRYKKSLLKKSKYHVSRVSLTFKNRKQKTFLCWTPNRVGLPYFIFCFGRVQNMKGREKLTIALFPIVNTESEVANCE